MWEDIDHRGTEEGVLPGEACRTEEELLSVLMGETGTSIGCPKENNIKGEMENLGEISVN